LHFDEALRYLVRSAERYVTAPLPWEVQSTSALAYLPEQVVWYVLVVLAPVGLLAALRRDALVASVLLAHALVAAITVALTAAYEVIAASALARAALAGVAPVTGGMTIATAALLVRTSARHGRTHLAIDLAVCLASLVAAVFLGIPTLAAIGAGAAIGALALGREPPTSRESSVG